MKAKLTHLQIAMLLANFVMTIAFIHFPLTQVIAGNNAWLVLFLIIPFTILLIVGGLIGINKLPASDLFSPERKSYCTAEKGLACLFIFFITLLLLNDVPSFLGAIQLILLPLTSTFLTTILTMLLVAYVARQGLSTIANFHELFLPPMLLMMMLNPITLLPKIDPLNVIPILNVSTYPSILQAAFNALPWAGEAVVLFFLLGQVQPLKHIRLTAIIGTAVGLSVLYMIIFMEIGVFNIDLMNNQTNPTLSLTREVQLTETIDRIDLLLLFFWIPTVFAKLSLEVFVLYRSIQILTGLSLKLMIYPTAVGFGLLSMVFFANNMDHFRFFMKNSNLGGALILVTELLIVLAFIVMVRLKKFRSI